MHGAAAVRWRGFRGRGALSGIRRSRRFLRVAFPAACGARRSRQRAGVLLPMGWYYLSLSDHRGSPTVVKAASPGGGEVLAVIWNKLERQRAPNSSLAPSLANVRGFPDPISAAEATDDQ